MRGLDGMGKETVYCSLCGDRIPSQDFEKGKAVTVLKKHFCRKCALSTVKDSSQGQAHDPTVTPSRVKIRTQRMPLADKPSRIGSNRIPFLIAAIIGALAFALLAYVFLSGKSG